MSAFVLSASEYNLLWRRLNLTEKPLVIETDDHGDTLSEQRVIDERAWRSLSRKGLVEHDEPIPMVEDVLGLIARPALEADLRTSMATGDRIRALIAINGARAALATLLPDQGLKVEPMRADTAVPALVRSLPPHHPAPGTAVNIPAQALANPARSAPGGLRWKLVDAGVRQSDAARFVEMFGGRMLATTKIGAATRDRLGRRHRHPVIITVLDTDAGRSAVRSTGRDWIVVSPVDQPRLISHITGLVAEAGSGSSGWK